jgi:hypothetical protein
VSASSLAQTACHHYRRHSKHIGQQGKSRTSPTA